MAWTLPELTLQIQDRVAAMGFEVWDVRVRGTSKRPVVQVRVDRSDAAAGQGISIDECAEVSRSLEAWLDASRLLGPRYLLEVSSPGIERPLRRPQHWGRYLGHEVRVRLPDLGRVTATIVAVHREPDRVELQPAGGADTVTVPLEAARDASLVVDWSHMDHQLNRKDHKESA